MTGNYGASWYNGVQVYNGLGMEAYGIQLAAKVL